MFGPEAHWWRFGSRTNDSQRGGDIDLYAEVERALPDRVSDAVRFAARVEPDFGGLPVDVVLHDSETSPQSIHEIAKRTRVRPCISTANLNKDP